MTRLPAILALGLVAVLLTLGSLGAAHGHAPDEAAEGVGHRCVVCLGASSRGAALPAAERPRLDRAPGPDPTTAATLAIPSLTRDAALAPRAPPY